MFVINYSKRNENGAIQTFKFLFGKIFDLKKGKVFSLGKPLNENFDSTTHKNIRTSVSLQKQSNRKRMKY